MILVEFEVITAEVTKNAIFWEIMQYNHLKVNRRFGGTCSLPTSRLNNRPSKTPA
jgi:hypothetical protein